MVQQVGNVEYWLYDGKIAEAKCSLIWSANVRTKMYRTKVFKFYENLETIKCDVEFCIPFVCVSLALFWHYIYFSLSLSRVNASLHAFIQYYCLIDSIFLSTYIFPTKNVKCNNVWDSFWSVNCIKIIIYIQLCSKKNNLISSREWKFHFRQSPCIFPLYM